MACAFTPQAPTPFATFGNAQTKALIKAWQPQPLSVASGAVLLPSSTENMKRFVRARILLEEPSTGCISSFDDSLCVILCKFSKAEHQLLMPLWHPDVSESTVFENLLAWHKEAFGSQGARLSGARLEWQGDRAAWAKAASQ